MVNQLLFICTGNYYRSRFAEALFNHHATTDDLPWRAFSRGLAIDLAPPGLSPHTDLRLRELDIPFHHTAPERQSLTPDDLLSAHRTIALQRSEHHPMMLEQFPQWAEQIEYWEVLDQEYAPPEESLARITNSVQQLLHELRTGHVGSSA